MALQKVGTILQYNDMNEVYQDLINTYLFMYCFCFFLNVFSVVHLLVLFICFVGFYSTIGLKVDLLVTLNWSPSSCHHAFSKWGTTFRSLVKDRFLALNNLKSKLPPPPLQSAFARCCLQTLLGFGNRKANPCVNVLLLHTFT